MNKLKNVTIYTDGACIENPGPGGYGVIIDDDGYKIELSGGFRRTTNNRMEMMAAIVGVEVLKERCLVTVYSDSQYLVKAISLGWAKRWQKNGWKRNKRDAALNPDLWERLLKVCEAHNVEFRWIRGHSSHSENERCDQLAKEAAMRHDLPSDNCYESPPYRLF
ncbi:ribonuclease HI [Chloroflexota bacterium]